MLRTRLLPFLALTASALTQEPAPRVAVAPNPAPVSTIKPAPAPAAADTGFAPTWETQKAARTYLLGIPAPRGQIVDRNGEPLAQTRMSQNLGIQFPTPLRFSEREVMLFAQRQVQAAQSITGRPIALSEELVLKHYKNRGVIPFVIAQDLKPHEVDALKKASPASLVFQPTYQRFYPNGPLAGHIVGYAGRTGRTADGPIQNNELLWPGSEGREGLEIAFDDQLQGKNGQYNISFDPSGKMASEQVSIPPQPGYNVITTLDEKLQRLCETALEKGTKRGAMVIVDPNNGDILAMASWPGINPNWFVPTISTTAFKALNDDPNIPLLPRAYRSAYPPGSTFKVFVGLAAMQSGKVKPGDEFNCPSSMEIGNLTFRNWKKTDAGSLNFVDALTQSCNTWFYQVGMKIGSKPIIDYTTKLGLGTRTGIPLAAETGGLIPNDDYMLKVHKRKILNGDIANLSIGQGDTLTSPLQLAMAMGAVGNGGTLYAARLVQQVQSVDGQIVNAYGVRARSQVEISKEVLADIKQAMVAVVESRMGTAGKAQVPGVHLAGKTGTAQWGPKNKESTAAWFAGFVPADKPKYAFAVLYESDVKNADDAHGGTSAAPLIGRVMREVFKNQPKEKKKKKTPKKVEAANSEDGVPVRKAEAVQRED